MALLSPYVNQNGRNYTLGKGEVHFARFRENSQTRGGFRFFGNAPDFSLTRQTEMLDHYDSTQGIRNKDESIIIEQNDSGTVNIDNVEPRTLAYFFMGSVATISQTALTEVTDTFGAEPGASYQVGVTPGNPTGHRHLANVSITLTTPSTPLVEGTDYTVDAEMGLISFLHTSPVLDGDEQEVTVTYDAGESARHQIIAADQQIEGAMMFRARNPRGPRNDILMPWVKISPNGDLNLISEEWMQIPLNLEILTLPGMAPFYVDGRPWNPTT
jgi:hypothetical protein